MDIIYKNLRTILKKSKCVMWVYRQVKAKTEQEYSNTEMQFIKKNSTLWKESKKKYDDKILVDFTTLAPDNFWGVMKKAEAVREGKGYQICVCLKGKGKFDFNNYEIIKSFNPDEIIFEEKESHKAECLYNTIKLFFIFFYAAQRHSVESFIDYTFKKIKIGDCIYDTILRWQSDLYTIDGFSISSWEMFWGAAKEFAVAISLMKNNNFKVYFSPESAYLRKIRQRVFIERGVQTWIVNEFLDVQYTKENMYAPLLSINNFYTNAELKNMSISQCNIEKAEKYFNNRLSGMITKFDAGKSFGRKETISKEKILNYFGIKNKYNNILLASHVFSDAVHGNRQYIFKDYYEWLIYCLKKLSEIPYVNVFLKMHPSRDGYGENDISDYIERKYRYIHRVPDEWSTAAVLESMDVVLTAAGTIGLEAACLGKPTMLGAESYYSGTGIVPVAHNLGEYERFLLSLPHMRENDDPALKSYAKFVLYMAQERRRKSKIDLSKFSIMPGDNWTGKVTEQYEYLNQMIENISNVKDDEYKYWMEIEGV